MWYSPSTVRSFLAERMTPERKSWISRTLHGEQRWQKSITDRGRASPRSASTAALSSYDACEEQNQSLAAVRRVLAAADIAFVELPRLSHFGPTLVVDAEHTETAVAALLNGLGSRIDESDACESWTVRFRNVRGARLSRRTVREHPDKLGSVTCLRRRHAANGRELTGSAQTITVEMWKKVGG